MKPVLVLEGKSTQEKVFIYGNEELNTRASKGPRRIKDPKGTKIYPKIFLQPLPSQEFHLPCSECKRVRKITKPDYYYFICLDCLKK